MALLRELWYGAHQYRGSWSHAQAIKDLWANGYAERVCGASLKVQLFQGSHVDPRNYNALYGKGKFEQIVKRLVAVPITT